MRSTGTARRASSSGLDSQSPAAALSSIRQIDDDTRHRSPLSPGMGRPVVIDIPGATVVEDEAARDDSDLLTSYGWRLLARRASSVPDTTVTRWRIVARRDIEPAWSDDNRPPRGSRLLGDQHRTGTKT